ncbi:hypothetical protein IAS59_001525 [Cryptococcus gattii]
MIFAQFHSLLLLFLTSHLVLTTTAFAHTDHLSNSTPHQENPIDTLWASTNTAVPIVTREQHIPQLNVLSVQLPRKPQQLPNPIPAHTETIHLPTPQQSQGVSPFIHPLSIILIICAVLGFISTFTTSPFSFQMSSSSSSKPSGSSSSPSNTKPSSSSSSSPSTPKPTSPQPVPTISANAWMSFFLFCCLVLIILQGPLGLTGGGALSGVAQSAQRPNFGGEWWTGWGGLGSGLGLGGAPGCVGVVAGLVPWCQPQVHQSPPQLARTWPLPQVQIQQIVQNPPPLPPPHYPPPRQRIVSYRPAAGAGSQMGGQGGFPTPEGGGGWSWYVNGPSPAFPGVVRQYTYPRGQYHPGQQRSVQYQRPGLQLQVTTGPQQPGVGGNIQAQVQVQGGQPIRAVHPPPQQVVPCPPQAVPVHQPIGVTPDSLGGLANLENAFYPLLVGAIVLLVTFDYMS